jgi:acetaldehyde dehydrogenase (acetylating)
VGPGNVPAYIESSADVDRAVRDIISGTTFDNGTLCSSEQAIVCDRAVHDRVVAAVQAEGGYILNPAECDQLAAALITDGLLVNATLVGQTAPHIATAAGLSVPDDTTVLVCPQDGVGPDFPLSHEKLSPVLALYQVDDWREGCERCKQLLQFGGLGHTMVIHSEDDDIVLEFGLYKPAHRILVNTVSSVGAVGLTTNLFPSMTLGCGSWGNNSTSDNVGPQHLLNIKRLARGVRAFQSEAVATRHGSRPTPPGSDAGSVPATTPAGSDGVDAQVEDFLRSRGIISAAVRPGVGDAHRGGCGCDSCEAPRPQADVARSSSGADKANAVGITDSIQEAEGKPAPEPVDFVAEFDVRQAIDRGVTIRIGPRTIITPLANDLGKEHGIFRRR